MQHKPFEILTLAGAVTSNLAHKNNFKFRSVKYIYRNLVSSEDI